MVKCDLHCLDKIKKYIVNIKIIEIILFTLITKQGPHLTYEQVLCVQYCDHKGKEIQIRVYLLRGIGNSNHFRSA